MFAGIIMFWAQTESGPKHIYAQEETLSLYCGLQIAEGMASPCLK